MIFCNHASPPNKCPTAIFWKKKILEDESHDATKNFCQLRIENVLVRNMWFFWVIFQPPTVIVTCKLIETKKIVISVKCNIITTVIKSSSHAILISK